MYIEDACSLFQRKSTHLNSRWRYGFSNIVVRNLKLAASSSGLFSRNRLHCLSLAKEPRDNEWKSPASTASSSSSAFRFVLDKSTCSFPFSSEDSVSIPSPVASARHKERFSVGVAIADILSQHCAF